MPKGGVIDPDYFKDKRGHQYLLYRTQGTPSSIRLVELPSSGRPEGNARSTELVRRGGVIENPAMLRRGRQYVLITSEGEFGECSYKTTFRRSVRLTDWSRAKRQVLVDTKKSGLCGPGGADWAADPAASRCCSSTRGPAPARGQLPGRAQLRPREPVRRAALAVRGRAAVHQPAVTADQCLRGADPAAASADRAADPDAHPVHDAQAEEASNADPTALIGGSGAGRSLRWLRSPLSARTLRGGRLMRVLPCGEHAALVELEDLTEVLGLYATLRSDPPEGVTELVPAARTLLIGFDRAVLTHDLVAAEVRGRPIGPPDDHDRDELRIEVTYDGEDLDEVASAGRAARP